MTAIRWNKLLAESGHSPSIEQGYRNGRWDVLVALHAKKSASAVRQFRRRHPERPIVVALTGTDLYSDIKTNSAAQTTLGHAARLVLLQPDGLQWLPKQYHAKAVTIFQSATPPQVLPPPIKGRFEVSVSGHLRAVKDPFRAAMAVRRLPKSSKVQVTHMGAAMTESFRQRALRENAHNARYRWLGELPQGQAKRMVARSRLLVVSSRMEGGANVIAEAIVAKTPVLASDISGCRGMLGGDYPGYFDVGNTDQLRELLLRFETEETFRSALERACDGRAALFSPDVERRAWRELIHELNRGDIKP